MFGGVGFDSNGVNGDLNDLWEYGLTSGEWAWVGGSNTVPASGKGQSGHYGSRGVPANYDAPGGRWSSGAWTDAHGDLWLFGGAGYDANGNYDNLNDLWVYQPNPGSLATATPTLSIGSGTYTGAQSLTIADQIPGATIYYTTDGSAPTTGSAVYTGPITVGSAETIQAIALASGYGPSGMASASYTIVAPFSLGLGTGASSITVYPGGTANFNLILTPVGGSTFPAAITFTATGLPSGATATFSPSTVNAGSGLTNVTFAVQTQSESPAAAMLHKPARKPDRRPALPALPASGSRSPLAQDGQTPGSSRKPHDLAAHPGRNHRSCHRLRRRSLHQLQRRRCSSRLVQHHHHREKWRAAAIHKGDCDHPITGFRTAPQGDPLVAWPAPPSGMQPDFSPDSRINTISSDFHAVSTLILLSTSNLSVALTGQQILLDT